MTDHTNLPIFSAGFETELGLPQANRPANGRVFVPEGHPKIAQRFIAGARVGARDN